MFVAGTLNEAISQLDKKTPTLVISDIGLPDGSGLDLLPEMAERGIRVPVIVMSAYLARFGSEVPASPNIEVLPKPFELERFRALVRKRLEAPRSDQSSSPFAVADYLQLAGLARRSVVLSIQDGTHPAGKIVVQDGEPRWAEDHLGIGEQAFSRLALLSKSRVLCEPLDAPLSQSNLTGSLEHLLLEAARVADEGSFASPATDAQLTDAKSVPPEPASAPRPANVPPPPRPKRPPPPSSRTSASSLPTAPNTSPPASERTQEKNVTPTKMTKFTAQQIQSSDGALKAAAIADRQGSVLDSTGEADAESLSAVATMANRHVFDVAEELGLGRASAWHVSTGAFTWYVVNAKDELVVGQGSPNKNPIATLRKIAKTCGA